MVKKHPFSDVKDTLLDLNEEDEQLVEDMVREQIFDLEADVSKHRAVEHQHAMGNIDDLESHLDFMTPADVAFAAIKHELFIEALRKYFPHGGKATKTKKPSKNDAEPSA